MASIIYKFATSPDAAGRTVTVKDARTHETVTSGSFSNSADATGVVTYRPTLEEGDYYGEFTVPGVPGLEGEKHPVRTRRVDGVLDVPGSIAAGGGGGETATTGTLYLKVSGTGIDVSTEDWGDGSDLPYVLDTERMAGNPVPEWCDQDGDSFILKGRGNGAYLTQFAAKATLTYPDSAPESIAIDVQDTFTNAINVGWYSDGSDDTPAFTPQQVTELEFFTKDSAQAWESQPLSAFPLTLVGLNGDNFGDLVEGTTLDVEARLAITKLVAGGVRYTEADLA